MENLNLNLSKNEFSKSRKILLWIIGLLFFSGAIWSLYLGLYMHDTSVTAGLIVVLFAISAFIFFIATLASVKKKDHYFIIDANKMSYRYGLIFPKHRSHNWSEIKEIIIQYKLRKATIITGDDKQKIINLNWINHSSARAILKHLYYTARKKDISISKT